MTGVTAMVPLFATSGDRAMDYLTDYWHEANARWFRGKLEPIPIQADPFLRPLARYVHGIFSGHHIAIRAELLRDMDDPQRYWDATGVLLHEMIHQRLAQNADLRDLGPRSLGGHGDEFTAWCNRIGPDLGLVPVVARKPRGRKVPLSRHWPSCAKPNAVRSVTA